MTWYFLNFIFQNTKIMFQVTINLILIYSFSDGSEITPTFGNKGKIFIQIK